MWIRVSRIILRNKILLLTFLALITIFLGYHARKVEMSYEYASMLPKKDRAFQDNQKFIEVFGEEGNLIIIGIQDSTFFEFDKFQKWKTLCKDLLKVEGVENLLSVSNAYNLHKNTEEKKFEIEMVFPDTISNQEELDGAVDIFKSLPFYKKLLYNDESNTYLIAITVNKDKMLSKEREKMVKAIQKIGKQFEKEENVTLHYSGLPYIRVVTAMIIKSELYLFSALALMICIVVLFLFFRSFKAVFFPVMVVLIGVIWSLGTLGLLGFKITILSGMIPSLLIVIGIPNSIYMMNKFHHEFVKHGNKVKALQRVIVKIGNATFLTNLTTALGFATFIIVKSDLLKQFGIVASLNIMGLFVLSLILIPVIFSFIKTPSPRHVRHLEYKVITRLIAWFINATQKHRKWVYATTAIILVLGIWGMTLMKSSGYVVDDIPKDNPIYTDLKFFEKNFNGLMPLEIMIDTKKPGGAMQLSTFGKIDELEKKLEKYDELSTPTSILNLLKFSKQAFYNGSENYYSLPNNREKNFILQYAATGEKNSDLLHSFLDSTRQFTRISIRVKDVGVKRMEELYTGFYNDIDSVFNKEDFNVTVTGTSITVFKGTNYLLNNLLTSLALAIALISLIMALMFSSWRMVVMSLTPNIIPLIFTAAVMGFSGIPIKASTILVFSIAFGISVDNTIHFLAKYRQELKATGWDIKKSVVLALSETGVSMLYTSVVLFFGFGIFAVSSFGGTRAMGILVSLTLVVAVISNLILLPTLLFSLDRLTTTRAFKEPMLHIYDEEEDIELEDLEINHIAKNKED
jgi:uncharacterized protein